MQNPTPRTHRSLFTGLIAGAVALAGFAGPACGQVINESLILSGGPTEDFGASISIDNNSVAVGAPRAGFADTGAAYLYDATTGAQLFTLAPLGGGNWSDRFGDSIAIDMGTGGQGTVVVGATGDDTMGTNAGAAYLFNATTGNQIAKLLPPSGNWLDLFGSSVAIDSGIVVVGAKEIGTPPSTTGSAYLYNATNGALMTQLFPTGAAAFDQFGFSVAIDMGTGGQGIVVVGAPRDDTNGTDAGAVYLFNASGNQIAKIPGGAANDQFGTSVSIDNGIVAVGARGVNNFAGSVYLFDASTGAQIAQLSPTGGAASNSSFGSSISFDNGIVAVGAYGANSAYLFDADPASPTFGNQIAQLLPSNGSAGDFFGISISIDNGTIAVGALLSNGSAYLFDAPAVCNPQLPKILPNDGATDDRFGSSIAIGNGIVAVGALRDDDNGPDSGSVYLFDTDPLSSTYGCQIDKFHPTSSTPTARFGSSIAIDNSVAGGVVAVGAHQLHSAYLFDTSGSQLFKLLPVGGGAAGDFFGWSIGIDNGIVAVGALGALGTSGSAYLFDADPSSPTFGDQITQLLPIGVSGGDRFGSSIAIDNSVAGGLVAVGAPFDDTNGNDVGAAYLFNATTGVQLHKIFPSSSVTSGRFGSSISIDNGIIAVGAPWDNTNGVGAGAVYLFDAAGVQLHKLIPNGVSGGDSFGSSVSIDNGIVAVGAGGDDTNGTGAGAAYLFNASTGCQIISKLLAPGGAAGDNFGSSIDLDGCVVAVGALFADGNGLSSGSAYVFDMPIVACPANVNNSGGLSPTDFTAWIAAFNSGAPECDQNGDCLCTPADFTAWIANFNAGCAGCP